MMKVDRIVDFIIRIFYFGKTNNPLINAYAPVPYLSCLFFADLI
jgi:hypothetical protein